jgi:hypothetical protein
VGRRQQERLAPRQLWHGAASLAIGASGRAGSTADAEPQGGATTSGRCADLFDDDLTPSARGWMVFPFARSRSRDAEIAAWYTPVNWRFRVCARQDSNL